MLYGPEQREKEVHCQHEVGKVNNKLNQLISFVCVTVA